MAGPGERGQVRGAFEDLTRPEERRHGVYLIRVEGEDRHSASVTGAYETARRLARRKTAFGNVTLSFGYEVDTPAL